MSSRVITKSLATQQDLLFGEGLQEQKRADGSFVLDKIRLVYPVNSVTELGGLDPEQFPKVRVYESNTVTDYMYKNDTYEPVLLDARSVDFSNLPSSDPEVVGKLWSDSGVLKVSGG
tara:strand:- start:133 stop:483 length:351 start_codon:yes stop_codon:yes gene_type:complete